MNLTNQEKQLLGILLDNEISNIRETMDKVTSSESYTYFKVKLEIIKSIRNKIGW